MSVCNMRFILVTVLMIALVAVSPVAMGGILNDDPGYYDDRDSGSGIFLVWIVAVFFIIFFLPVIGELLGRHSLRVVMDEVIHSPSDGDPLLAYLCSRCGDVATRVDGEMCWSCDIQSAHDMRVSGTHDDADADWEGDSYGS